MWQCKCRLWVRTQIVSLTEELQEAEEPETVAGVIEVTVGGWHAARVTEVLRLLTPLKRIQVQHTAAGKHMCRVYTDSAQR